MRIARPLLLPLLSIALISTPADARVVRIEILSRSDITGTFGSAGTYERITGRVYFAFDPRIRKIVRSSISTWRRGIPMGKWKP